MFGGLPYERALQEYLKDEFRALNAHLPRKQKSLLALLHEEYPHVVCNDGSTHFFKRKELEYLASLVDVGEQEALLLPVFIELRSEQDEVAVICERRLGEKIISEILNMPVTGGEGKLIIYKSQLGEIRKVLKTTTQYLFRPKILE